MAKFKIKMKQYARSRSVRKIFKRTPGGVTVVLTRRRKKGGHSCELCGVKISNLRGDGRVFGGVLCARCLDKVIGYYARIIDGALRPEDVELRYQKYVNILLSKKK